MKKYIKIIIVIALSVAFGLATGLLVKSSGRAPETHEHKTETDDVTVWTCSMHPSVRQPEFGQCPICGMDLIPLKNEKQSSLDANTIAMSETAMALADIQTAVVTAGPAVKTLTLNAVVEPDERLSDVLSSHIDGRVEDLLLDFTGQQVVTGDPVATIYSPELITAQQELFEALKVKHTQPVLLDAAISKLKSWKLSDEQISDIIAAGQPQETLTILADRSGVVTGKRVKRGDYVKRGQALYDISDLGHLWVMLDVYEKDIEWVQTGDSVTLEFASLPGDRFSGTIAFIDPVLDPVTRVAKARIDLNNPEDILKPGMYGYGQVSARLEDLSGLPQIPASAVMWTGKRSLVYVKYKQDDGIEFKMREVTLGPRLADSYVILDGLQTGEQIAVNGTFSIDAAAQLSGKNSMMNRETATVQPAMAMDMDDTPQNSSAAQAAAMAMPVEISEGAVQALAPIYDTYLKFKDALVGDNAKKAKKELLTLKKELEAIDMSLFAGAAHEPFMDSWNLILNHIPDKSKLSDIERLRAAFEYVSNGMIAMTKTFSPQEGTLYVQHCPMAFNNKGADWISREHDIRNPYFGASMLTCGDVTDTLTNLK